MATSSKRTSATCHASQVCSSQSPCPHCRPLLTRASAGDTQTLAQSLVGFLGPGAHKVLFETSEHLWWVWGLILNAILPLLLSYWGFSFALGCGVSFFGGIRFSSVQFISVTQSCPTLCNPMDCSTPGLPVHHQLPELTQIHVHLFGDAIQSSHPLSSPSPPTFSLFQHQGVFKLFRSSHQLAKTLEFQVQHQSFQ